MRQAHACNCTQDSLQSHTRFPAPVSVTHFPGRTLLQPPTRFTATAEWYVDHEMICQNLCKQRQAQYNFQMDEHSTSGRRRWTQQSCEACLHPPHSNSPVVVVNVPALQRGREHKGFQQLRSAICRGNCRQRKQAQRNVPQGLQKTREMPHKQGLQLRFWQCAGGQPITWTTGLNTTRKAVRPSSKIFAKLQARGAKTLY